MDNHLTKRLRLHCVCYSHTCVVCEAADEIERLHAALQQREPGCNAPVARETQRHGVDADVAKRLAASIDRIDSDG